MLNNGIFNDLNEKLNRMDVIKLDTENILGNSNMKYAIDFGGTKQYFTEKAILELREKLNNCIDLADIIKCKCDNPTALETAKGVICFDCEGQL